MKNLFCLLSLFFLSYSFSIADSFDFEYQKIIDVENKAELELINGSGNVKIEGAAIDQVIISAVKHVRATDLAEAEVVADHIEIKAFKNGDRIRVETRFLKMSRTNDSFWKKLFGSGSDSFGSIDFEISVPYYCKLDIDNTSGTVIINNIDNNIRVTSATGEINISGVEGDIDIAGTSSIVFIASLEGDADIRTTTGDIEVSGLFGNLKGKSTSGDIKLYQESGSHIIGTNSGDIRVKTELNTDRECHVETDTGRIYFLVPSSSSGKVKLETISGSINTELPLTVKQFAKNKLNGEFGHNGPKIILETQTGDITLGQF